MVAGEQVVGTRVRVESPSPSLRLETDTGRIVRLDDQCDGYVIVRLDSPAHYDNGIESRDLDEIRVALDNVTPMEPRGDWPQMPAYS